MKKQILTVYKSLVLLSVALSCLCSGVAVHAQSQPTGTVSIFAGVDFNYRDIYFNNRVFDVLLNLTPGVRWEMGKRWQIAGQVIVPVINQYGAHYRRVRLNMAVLSKQLAVGNRWKMKFSGGLFGSERYGLDWKSMFVVNGWFALSADVALTGNCSMATGWTATTMKRLTYQAGPEFYLERWNTQFIVRGGRYLFGDYGGVAEAFRHFKHASVGFYASYSNRWKKDLGFKVVVMLPPYKRTVHKVMFRPADDFRLTYSMEASEYANRGFFTDPEQNERSGWFDRDLIPWGTDKMAPDFVYRTSAKPKSDEARKEVSE